jgi:hypothetical protein
MDSIEEMLLKKLVPLAPVAVRKDSYASITWISFRVSGVPRRTLSLRRPVLQNGRLAPHL